MASYNQITLQDIIIKIIEDLLLKSQIICITCVEKDFCRGCKLNFMIENFKNFLETFK